MKTIDRGSDGHGAFDSFMSRFLVLKKASRSPSRRAIETAT